MTNRIIADSTKVFKHKVLDPNRSEKKYVHQVTILKAILTIE
jgi:hypothetical protein